MRLFFLSLVAHFMTALLSRLAAVLQQLILSAAA
jgi:hypothetical protein